MLNFRGYLFHFHNELWEYHFENKNMERQEGSKKTFG